MGEYLADIAARYPDNQLIKRLPPQAFFTSYLSVLVADVSKGAKETWTWLAALCYRKTPIRAATRNHFEVEFLQLTGIAKKTGRDHFAELMAVDLLRCYRTSQNELLIYPVGVVPLPGDEEMNQLTLLDVGDENKDESPWRKSANDVGENPPSPIGRLGSKASLKPDLPKPTTKTTATDSRLKHGEKSPTSRRKVATPTPPPPAFGENPPNVHPVKEPATPRKKVDTTSLTPEGLEIFERLEQIGFGNQPLVTVARMAAEQGYTADEVVTHAQTIIAELEQKDGINSVMGVALHRLGKLYLRPKPKPKTATKGETASARRVREALEAQNAEWDARAASLTPEQRLQQLLEDMSPADRARWEAMSPDEQAAILHRKAS